MARKWQRAGLDTGCPAAAGHDGSCTHPRSLSAAFVRVSFHAAAAVLMLLLSTGCAQAVKVSVACSMVAHFADITTTAFVLGSGKGKELNTILAPFSDKPVALAGIKGSAAVGANWVLLELADDHPKWTFALGAAQCVGFSAVAAHNARIIRQR